MENHVYAERRRVLVERLQHSVALFAPVDVGNSPCGDVNTFFYFTGLRQLGLACCIMPDGTSILYVPRYRSERLRWEGDSIIPSLEVAQKLGFDSVVFLGEECTRFSVSLFDPAAIWSNLLGDLKDWFEKGLSVGWCKHPLGLRFELLLPELHAHVVSIDSEIAHLRRRKTKVEVGHLTRACDITALAHEAAIYSILDKSPNELTVRAAVEYLFTEHGAALAFPSVVASGVNATVLHHKPANIAIEKNDLVVVDVGAKFEGYCADISRTYPVSGKFSDRQRYLYEIVLSVQEAVAEAACPGMFLRNPEEPEKSLHHIACAIFKEHNLDAYFIHGIGHYLGLDVHDIGSYSEPLVEGDVITIEPGVYIPEENIGIRIEDDFWIVSGGAVCLSDSLPRSVEDVERLCAEIKTI